MPSKACPADTPMELVGAERPDGRAPAARPGSRATVWLKDSMPKSSARRTQANSPKAGVPMDPAALGQGCVLGDSTHVRCPRGLRRCAQVLSDGGQRYVGGIQRIVNGAHSLVRKLACGGSKLAQVDSALDTVTVAELLVDCTAVHPTKLGVETALDAADSVSDQDLIGCGMDTDVDLTAAGSTVNTPPVSPRRVTNDAAVTATPVASLDAPLTGVAVPCPHTHPTPSPPNTSSPTHGHAVQGSASSGTSSPAQPQSSEQQSGDPASAPSLCSDAPSPAEAPGHEQETGDAAMQASVPGSGTSSQAPQHHSTNSLDAEQRGLAITALMTVASQLSGTTAAALKVAVDSGKKKVPDWHLNSSKAAYSQAILQLLQVITAMGADLLVGKEQQAAQIVMLQHRLAEELQANKQQAAAVAELRKAKEQQADQVSQLLHDKEQLEGKVAKLESLFCDLHCQLSDAEAEGARTQAGLSAAVGGMNMLLTQLTMNAKTSKSACKEMEDMWVPDTAPNSSKEVLQLLKALSKGVGQQHTKLGRARCAVEKLYKSVPFTTRRSLLYVARLIATVHSVEDNEGREIKARSQYSDIPELRINSGTADRKYVVVEGNPEVVECQAAEWDFVWESQQQQAATTGGQVQPEQPAATTGGQVQPEQPAATTGGKVQEQPAATGSKRTAGTQQAATQAQGRAGKKTAAAKPQVGANKQQPAANPQPRVASRQAAAAAQHVARARKQGSSCDGRHVKGVANVTGPGSQPNERVTGLKPHEPVVAASAEKLQSSKLRACDDDTQLTRDSDKQLACDSSGLRAHKDVSGSQQDLGSGHEVHTALVVRRTHVPSTRRRCTVQMPLLEYAVSEQGLPSAAAGTLQPGAEQQQEQPLSAASLDVHSVNNQQQGQVSMPAHEGVSANVLQGVYVTDAPVCEDALIIEGMDITQLLQLLQAGQGVQGGSTCSATASLEAQQHEQPAAALTEGQPQLGGVPDMSQPTQDVTAALLAANQSFQQLQQQPAGFDGGYDAATSAAGMIQQQQQRVAAGCDGGDEDLAMSAADITQLMQQAAMAQGNGTAAGLMTTLNLPIVASQALAGDNVNTLLASLQEIERQQVEQLQGGPTATWLLSGPQVEQQQDNVAGATFPTGLSSEQLEGSTLDPACIAALLQQQASIFDAGALATEQARGDAVDPGFLSAFLQQEQQSSVADATFLAGLNTEQPQGDDLNAAFLSAFLQQQGGLQQQGAASPYDMQHQHEGEGEGALVLDDDWFAAVSAAQGQSTADVPDLASLFAAIQAVPAMDTN